MDISLDVWMYLYTSLENALGLLPRTSSLEARLLLREVFAPNRSAPTITGMITRRLGVAVRWILRCLCSRIFFFYSFFSFFLLFSILFRKEYQGYPRRIKHRGDTMLLHSTIIRAIDIQSFNQFGWWFITLNVVKYIIMGSNPSDYCYLINQ